MKHLTLERTVFIVLLIAALILLKKCGKDRDTYRAQSDYLRWEAQQDDSARLLQEWQYQNDTATYRSEAREQAKKADSIGKVARGQIGEIRQLYALLREPWPENEVDTNAMRKLINSNVARSCCSTAVALSDSYESLLLVDSLKDGAYMSQIDLATVRIDTLQNQLNRSDRRFWVMDSLNRVVVRGSKVRAKIALGVAGGVTTGFGWAGGSVMYSGPGGTSIGVDVGLSNAGGMYYGARVLRVISFRKKR